MGSECCIILPKSNEIMDFITQNIIFTEITVNLNLDTSDTRTRCQKYKHRRIENSKT